MPLLLPQIERQDKTRLSTYAREYLYCYQTRTSPHFTCRLHLDTVWSLVSSSATNEARTRRVVAPRSMMLTLLYFASSDSITHRVISYHIVTSNGRTVSRLEQTSLS